MTDGLAEAAPPRSIRALGVTFVLIVAIATASFVLQVAGQRANGELLRQNSVVLERLEGNRAQLDTVVEDIAAELARLIREHDARTAAELRRLLSTARLIIERAEDAEGVVRVVLQPSPASPSPSSSRRGRPPGR